ncbi:MAG TPA: MarR family transcriptional regulator [Anaerolineaceae bacterium]|nr:MarR family transcriptional regulator [Anaerolineaceae bacterium]HPN52581.1 MarR family transcriptional regulator [Anaerolineaceae bacterium]
MHSQHPEPQTLDFLLAQVSRLHHHRAHELLDGLGLYRGQPPVLFALQERDGLTHGELAARLGVTPATITRMIQRMEKTGFVLRQPDDSDQRISRVFLTEAGRAVFTELQMVWSTMEAESFAGFNDEERIVLRAYLQRIRENLIRVINKEIEDI